MRPHDVKTEKQVCSLRTDNCNTGKFWMMTDGKEVSIHEQKIGEDMTQVITVPRSHFNKLIAWYMRKQVSPIIIAILVLTINAASAQVTSINGVTGNITLDPSLEIVGNVLRLRQPPAPLGPILDANINNGAYSAGHMACMADSNCQISSDTLQIISRNQQIQPGSIGIGGTWAAGETASILFSWTGGVASISCVVGTTCGPMTEGNRGITQTLANQFLSNTALQVAPLYNNGAIFEHYPAIGLWGWSYLTTWDTFNSLTMTNQSSTAGGTITLNRALNKLDGPVGILLYRAAPATGAIRPPQPDDYIASVQFLGASTNSPLGGIPFVRLDAFVTDPTGPQGLFTIATQCPGLGGVTNTNGCARVAIQQGLSLYDAGGAFIDHGATTITTPETPGAGFYLGTIGAMTADNNGPGGQRRWVINSSGGFGFSAPGLFNCSKGIRTDGAGNLSCVP